jgi:hypothetical protein
MEQGKRFRENAGMEKNQMLSAVDECPYSARRENTFLGSHLSEKMERASLNPSLLTVYLTFTN